MPLPNEDTRRSSGQVVSSFEFFEWLVSQELYEKKTPWSKANAHWFDRRAIRIAGAARSTAGANFIITITTSVFRPIIFLLVW